MSHPARHTGQRSRSSKLGRVRPKGPGLRGLIVGCVGLCLVFATAGPGLAAIPAATTGAQATIGLLGSRPGATRLPVPINDHVQGSVDVGTGNLMVTVAGLALPGIGRDVPLGLVFNSQSTDTSGGDIAPRWTLALGSTGSLSSVSSNLLYTTGDGYSALFTPVAGSSTDFTAPAGTKADLVKITGGYKLTSRLTAEVVTFNDDGRTTSVADRNGNTTSFTPSTGKITSVVATKGVLGARTATLTYDSQTGELTGFSQTNGGSSRSVSFARDGSGNLSSFTDLTGNTTTFGYTSNRITSITPPTGGATNISYDSNGKVTQIEKVNTSPGSPGNSITRFTYPSATQTLMAGPNTSTAVAVATGPHTTYDLTTDGRVSQVTDPEGRIQTAIYTGDFDTLTETRGADTTAGTTTKTYGANTGESATASEEPGGATNEAAYDNTAGNLKYLPTSSTDDAGNQSTYTYNAAGNMLTSTNALGAVTTLTYNTDGTVATALAPGNGTNTTQYGYDSNHQRTSLTPVTGSSLGSQAFTYDTWGRPATATNGRGTTLTYSYDADGRLGGVSFSDSTPSVSYTYNDNGQVLTRVDANGTTTYGYDQMGRLTSRVNTAGGGTINYAYDKASNLVSTTDARGTTSYTFDDSGVMETLVYLIQGVQKTLAVATDNRGLRTDTWLQASPSRTQWKAHTHTDYDTSGRVTRVVSKSGEGDTNNTTVVDLSYCYAAGSTAPACSTATTADRSKIRWMKNNLTGAVTTYTYDAAGRLTQAAVTGISNPPTYNYTYDSRGNRLTAPSQTLTFNAANQISTSSYSYDGAGNLTADPNGTYAYNGGEQMTSVTKNSTTYNYTYAGTTQNEVLSQVTPNGTYRVTYGRTDAHGQPVVEQYRKDNLTAYVENDPVTGQALMLRTSSGMQSLYVYDGTGNPAALLTSSPTVAFGYDYDPYGVPTLTADSGGLGTSQNPYAFKAGIQDRTTGWVKFGVRWYNPTTGRWTQQDPIDLPLSPGNANRYAFAACDPINGSDPSGLYGPICNRLWNIGWNFEIAAAGATLMFVMTANYYWRYLALWFDFMAFIYQYWARMYYCPRGL